MTLNQKLTSTVLLTALLVLAASVARADVVFVGAADIGESGLDHQQTIMTMQATGHEMDSHESSCVGVSDSARLSTTVQGLQNDHQTDANECKGGNEGDFGNSSDKDKDKDKDGEDGKGDKDKDDTPPPGVAPEPTTLLLLGTGLCLLGGVLRRRLIAAA